MSIRLEPGTPAPAFTLPDASGAEHSLSDYTGSKVILYFYPKASTPGCTKEACDFRDNLASLKSLGYCPFCGEGVAVVPVAFRCRSHGG